MAGKGKKEETLMSGCGYAQADMLGAHVNVVEHSLSAMNIQDQLQESTPQLLPAET